MKRLALVLCVVAVLPSAAAGAGCSPLDCGPSGTPLAGGRLLGVRPFGAQGVLRVVDMTNGRTRFRLPPGILGADRLVHQDGSLLTWFDAATGRRVGDAVVPGRYQLVGLSGDGSRAVVALTQRRSTIFAIVAHGRPARDVVLTGHWGFDALVGSRLFVLQYLRKGYEVRLYDLAGGGLAAKPLKDGDEPALIQGVPWERLASPDGRYLFTLYVANTGEAMIHELDLRAATARCVDLPGSGDFNGGTAYGLALAPDGRTLYAISPAYGAAATVDVAAARVTHVTHFAVHQVGGPIGTATAIAPSGRLVVAAVDAHTWFFDTRAERVRSGPARVAIAVGFSPNGKRVWYVGERSRVRALVVG